MTNQAVDRCDYNVGEYIDNRYQVSKTLGEGSFGKVYRVTDGAGKNYALKLLRLWEVPPDIRKPLMDRFEMEFKTGQIDCDYLVRSLDYGTVGGNPFIVMEYCSGGDLTPYLGSGSNKIPLICQQILLGLHALHIRGKVHRDLKPENVLFKSNGMAALTDFGIAGDRNKRMTERNIFGKPNQIFGTYAYMPPEQVNRVRGEATVLPTTDIFSFGVLAFQLLTGSLPFGELTSHNELAQYQKRGKNGEWNRQKLAHIKNGEQWHPLFSGCLNPDFKSRFQSIKEVLKYLPEVTQVVMEKGYCPPQIVRGFCMRIMQGEEFGKIYQLSDLVQHGRRILTIGRGSDNLLPVKERQSAYVSRHHCTIETTPAGDYWIIRDGQWQKEQKTWQESSNGTYVNSTQVTQQGYILKTGDIVSIGDVKMRFENY
ncbi:FHA domain-containing serine/threonine-protein kinase [Bacteroides sp. GD17]|uniref:FHA domain-containing serine/threonine-protein kinase n=1 Tax=Bacteroides sp. GD17 TaxID=3139826 RepID=UPI0025E22487|nr:FHA domain-containing serine/threonine-protein kinase [uncultured Bacteroides sp.]